MSRAFSDGACSVTASNQWTRRLLDGLLMAGLMMDGLLMGGLLLDGLLMAGLD